MSYMFGMTWGWVNDNSFLLGELSFQVVLSIYVWALKTMTRSQVHVSERFLLGLQISWDPFYATCFQLPVWVSWASWKKPFMCVWVFREWLFESYFCLYIGSLCSTSLKLWDPCLFLKFFSYRLIFVTPSSSLSCDNENPDWFMTKHGLSTQPHSA